jgi:hypothetical protein
MIAFVLAFAAFTWTDGDGRLELRENGKPVIAYNYAMQLHNGAPEVKRLSGYVHPVWAPDGTVVTDDFPKDHWHHRGMFWAWPVVEYGGRAYDMWTLTGGIESRHEKWLDRTDGREARLAAENGWYVGEDRIARETVRIAVAPVKGTERRMQYEIAIEPLKAFAMAGMQDGKGYGGLNVRFAPRTGTVVRTDKGVEARDTDLVPHPWAELEAVYEGKKARLRIESDRANPGYPEGWCLRNYGFLGANYPGLKKMPMEPGKPLRLRYTVTVASID